MASSPRILRRRHRPDAEAIQKVPAPVHRRCACSGVKALRNTSAARRQSRQALLPFRSLDPLRALREPDRRRRDEERPFPLRTKNRQETKNDYLTGKAPYKFESPSLQQPVCLSSERRGCKRSTSLKAARDSVT